MERACDDTQDEVRTGRGRVQDATAPGGVARSRAPDVIAEELAAAIAEGRLTLAYQPLIDLRTYRLGSIEALARWHIPSEGWRAPDGWIPIAEERGLIIPFGRWALSAALAQVSALRAAGLERLPVAVNLSPLQLEDATFLEFLEASLIAHDVAPGDLDLELTERHFRMGLERLRPALESLRALGCRIHLDDYGTGDSSLQSLFNLPIDALKIDRTFVAGLPHDPRSAAIVDSTVTMAHRIGLTVIAEGIETIEQVDFLRQIGCNFGQGFVFSQPLSAQTLRRTLGDWDSRASQFVQHSVDSTVAPWRPGNGGDDASLQGQRILVVDDEPMILEITEAVLRRAGAEVVATNSVAGAIAAITAQHPDVVVSDLNMPGLNGWDFVHLVRHEAPDVRIVIVSGYVDHRQQAIHRPDAVVQKPYHAQQLADAVRSVVTRRTTAA